MTLNNIDNIFKLNFLGAPDLNEIPRSRDSVIPVARLRDLVIPGSRDPVKIRRDGIAKKKICAIKRHFFRGARWLNLSRLPLMLFR